MTTMSDLLPNDWSLRDVEAIRRDLTGVLHRQLQAHGVSADLLDVQAIAGNLLMALSEMGR